MKAIVIAVASLVALFLVVILVVKCRKDLKAFRDIIDADKGRRKK
jgi:hypothetical protein